MTVLKIGSASAKPGEIAAGRLKIGELREGTEFGLPVAAVNGAEDGPLLYIQAGSDGNELNGIGVVKQVLKQLDPSRLKGGILVVNPLNYHGFQQAKGDNPLDGKKLNRTFPGNSAGSISERLSAAVFKYIKECDLALDLHQSGISPMIDEVRVRVEKDHKLYQACMELAKVFGIEYILDKKGPKGQLAQAAPDQGIPTIDPELGGCLGWDERSIQKGVRGVFNVLYYYGFLDGECRLPQTYTIVDDFKNFYAGRGGLIEYQADFYQAVHEGDPLFNITDLFGKILEKRKSPAEGIFWQKKSLPMAATGEIVCSIGLNPRRESFN